MSTNLVSALGGGSGIDTKTLVSQLVDIEKAPTQQRIDSRQSTLQAQISGYGALKSALSTFQGILKPLSDSNTFSARSVAFTESNTVTPTKVEANALPGTYQVESIGLARVQSLSMAPVSDPKSVVGEGTINIRFGLWDGTSQFTQNTDRNSLSIEIDSTNNTLEGIRDAINASNSGIQASIVANAGQFQLLIASPTGEQNALEITATGALTDLDYREGFQNLIQNQAAQDAELKINGLTVKRPSNEITDVISGLTFSLNRANQGEIINFTISEDKATGEQAVRDFVTAYNDFLTFSRGLTGFSRDEDNQIVRGDLSTDSIARGMVQQIRDMMTSAIPGISGGASSLATLGIETQLDGSLGINETLFNQVLTNNFSAVSNIFAPKIESNTVGVQVEKGSQFANTQGGLYTLTEVVPGTKGQISGDASTVDFGTFDTASDTYSFQIRVNSVVSNTITLPADTQYSNEQEFAAALQSLINNDSNLKSSNISLDVSFDSVSGSFNFTSREYGSSSNVSFVSANNMSDFGINTGLSGTTGTDASGKINGVAGFGAGNVLLPAIGQPGVGLNFVIQDNAPSTAEVRVSKGLGSELNSLIAGFLSRDGGIKNREDTLSKQVTVVKEEQTRLDSRMEKRFDQLQAQFLAMERIIAQFQSTGNQLDGILDRLPFTASRK
ncbi:flagellar filament capping protein FliD [Nitrincola nitratireducens]|uniref:Flagellar hook-associated protein 2 n=1 Tax=Nitrincola nitratireducens TaxID=1229521 RepID=W9UQK9_9GAMM|nr:flagellar filament capping protein FliD [Nitrincola nitratireducens]EXJ09359.1 Flagellar cap protein [Nitrincola nitratireducens]